MEELLGNLNNARAVFERWMKWNPEDQVCDPCGLLLLVVGGWLFVALWRQCMPRAVAAGQRFLHAPRLSVLCALVP